MHRQALLARRLERLRTLPRAGTPAGQPLPAGGSRGAVSRDVRVRAGGLAESLGGRVLETPAGIVVVVERSLRLPAALAPLAALPYPIDPQRPLTCLDTETTGLGTAAGTVAFLVGLGSWVGDEFVTRQFVLPDHAHEPALLDAVAEHLPPDGWLVTYNGRTFDWPLLVTRYRLRRGSAPEHAGHLDLLPVARQLWRHRLPDARLASVEAGVVGVRRSSDIPGALIPERYFAFLRTGRGGLLREVVDHNRQDVVSLAQLLVLLAERLARAEDRRRAHPGDLGGLARGYARAGRRSEALACLDQALEMIGSVEWYRRVPHLEEWLIAERARLLARLGEREEAAAAWLALAHEGGRLAALGWLQVAKHREHVARDPAWAFEAAARAAALAARSRFTAVPLTWLELDLARRMPRLRRKLARGTLRRPSNAA